MGLNPEDQHPKSISVVCTIYKGASVVDQLMTLLVENLQPLAHPFEIILVDDCSPDDSWAVIEHVCKKYPFAKAIRLSRNFGQQIAMSAGMAFAKSDYVIIMDGDLQNPPSAIPLIVDKLKEGYEIVYTVSHKRNDLRNEISSRLFWFILTKILKINVIENQLMMKGMTRAFVSNYNSYGEIKRTVSAITNDIGMRFTSIEIENQKRHSGKSNYTFFNRFNLMIDVVISLSTAPLDFMIYIGLLTFLSTAGASVYHLVKYLFFDITPGFTSILLSLFLFGGLIITMLGLIGRYLANIYSEVRQRPLFLIQEKRNFNT